MLVTPSSITMYVHAPSTRHHSLSCWQLSAFSSGSKTKYLPMVSSSPSDVHIVGVFHHHGEDWARKWPGKGKIVGPDVGSRRMDKLDLCLIPYVYLFQMIFSILSLALFLALYFPEIVKKVLQNTARWIALICIRLILFTASESYRLVHIRQNADFFQQSSVVYTILFWTRFYFSIIKTKEKRRSLW